ARAVARSVGSLGGGSLLGERLLLASRKPSRLEQSLSVLMGRPFHMSISLPHEKGQRDRLWLLLVDGEGRALAFAKFAYQPESVHRLTREVHFTRFAAALELRTCEVPGVLCAQAVDDGLLMACPPLPADARESSGTLTSCHLAALEELAGQRGAVGSRRLVEQLRERCELLSQSLPRSWAERLARVLEVVEACPGLGDLPTVLSHGDFVPWNIRTRRGDGRLIVFDWEQAQESQFVLRTEE